MNQPDYSLIEKMNINFDAVIINQCDVTSRETIERNGNRILWINTTERGLSRSRNMAIDNADGEICVLADDDEVFTDTDTDKIVGAFDDNPDVSIIRFQVKGIEKKFKDYPEHEENVGLLKSLKTSSVEMAFRLDDIRKKNIRFDKLLGAGTRFLMGEENAFLHHCINSGLRMKYCPICIAALHIGNSSWFTGYNRDYFVGRGAAFTAIGRWMSIPYIVQFAVRRYGLYRDQMGYMESLKHMFIGRKLYLQAKQNETED